MARPARRFKTQSDPVIAPPVSISRPAGPTPKRPPPGGWYVGNTSSDNSKARWVGPTPQPSGQTQRAKSTKRKAAPARKSRGVRAV